MDKWWSNSQVVEDEPQQTWWGDSPVAEIEDSDPLKAREDAGKVWDIAAESSIPLSEAENVYYSTPQSTPAPDGLVKRFGKQYYNTTVASVVSAIGTKSEFGKTATLAGTTKSLEEDFIKRANAGEPVTEDEIEFYTAPYKSSSIGGIFGAQRPEWARKIRESYDAGKLNIKTIQSPQETIQRFMETYQAAETRRSAESDVSLPVSESENAGEKVVDAIAGISGFITQIGVLKKAAPTMPETLVWETVNLANGGKTGHGAAMQLTLGGINKAIPGIGFRPAATRAAITSGIFGTTTYLGGGDTTDILVNMGIPFAFESLGLTKQQWAKYKNKQQFIDNLKQQAPALQNRSHLEIDKAVGDLLTNVTTIGARELAAKGKKPQEVEVSTDVKNYLRQKRYDELVEKANSGDKTAIKELNDFIQGTNLPTYEQLLERGFSGDQKAFDLILEGNYKGGANPQPELKLSAKQLREQTAQVQEERPLTPIEKIKARAEVIENDIKPPENIDAANIAKAKERGFITSVKEVVPELKIEGQYIPRATDPLAIKAKNLIRDDLAQAERMALKGNNDTAVAVASELIKFYGEKAAANPKEADIWYERAATIASDAAHKLTEQGRAVQAASILGRLTPEGQVRFAAREIQKYNEKIERTRGGVGGLKKKIPELTKEQTKYILDEMKEITNMADGKSRHTRFRKLQEYIGTLTPTPVYQKSITLWKAGLLTGIKTSGLNIFANISHLGTETIKDIPAAATDKMVSIFTGKRSVTPTVKGLSGGGLEGVGKGFEYIRTGYSERDIGIKLDYKRTHYNTKALQAYTETVFRLLGAEDQPFYYAAKMRSMYEQAKVAAINQGLKGNKAQAYVDELMKNPTEQMIKYATKDAEAATFINNTKLGDIARGIQKLPGGEIVVPFGRTPSAVAMQIVNYSPVGIVKTIIENIGRGKFDQRQFSQGVGRGITGTAVIAIGAALYDNSQITLDYPTDERERKLWELEGRQPNSILIGGKWRTVQFLGPAGNLLIVGGHFKRAFEESGSPTEAMSTALSGSAKSFTEQTFLRGVNQFVDALADPERSASYVAGNTISSIVPVIVSDVARATDTQDRRAENVPEKIMAKIPGARQTLEPRITVLGEEKEPTANPLELMIDPTRPSKEISTPVIDELRRLWDEGWEVSPSQLGTRKGYEVLSQEENTELWKRAGTLTKEALTQLIDNPLYDKLPDEQKANAISDIISQTQDAAKTEIVVKKLSGLEGKELTDMIFELRKSGLATEKIIPVALSKRNPKKARKQQKE